MTWNWVDLVIALILIVNCINGAKRGLVRTLFGVFALIVAIFICFKGTPFVAEILQQMSFSGTVAYIVALVILFLIIYFLINDVGKHLHDLIKASDFKNIDFAGGIMFGFIKGTIFSLFLLIPVMGNIFSSPVLLDTFQTSQLLTIGRPLIYASEPLIQDIFFKGNSAWQDYQKQFSNISQQPNDQSSLEEVVPVLEEKNNVITNF